MSSARYKLGGTLGFLALLVGIASTAGAGLSSAPPKDVSLAGIWQINAKLSDDAQQVIGRRGVKRSSQSTATVGHGRATIHVPDAGEILGGMGGMDPRNTDPDDSRGGGYGQSHFPREDDPRTVDPSHEEKMRVFVDQLKEKAPDTVEIDQRPDAFTVQSAESSSTCKPGESAQVMLPGSVLADRKCGWSGGGFVIEVKAKTGATRTDRYTLSRGGDRLTVTSTLSGSPGIWSGLEIKHVYDRAVSLLK